MAAKRYLSFVTVSPLGCDFFKPRRLKVDDEAAATGVACGIVIKFHGRTCGRRLDSLLDSDNISTNISAADVVILLVARQERWFQQRQ